MTDAVRETVLSAMTAVVDDHMRRHPELHATDDGLADLGGLLEQAAERAVRELPDRGLDTVEAATGVLMDQVTEVARREPDGGEINPGTLRSALRSICPLWPFCS
jgi:hypothetical protein